MSKKILLVADSSTTMSSQDAQKYGVEILPLAIYRNDGKNFVTDLNSLTPEELLDMHEEGYTFTTSCTPQLLMEETLRAKLNDYDYILALPISSKWSSQYSHLKALSNEPEFKNRLYVADVLEYGYANENLCIDLRKMIDEEGLDDPELLVKYAEAYRHKTICYFACRNLNGLVASGRVPKAISKIFKLVKIYPLIKMEAENHLEKIIKNWDNIPNTMIKSVIKTYGGLKPSEIRKVTVLTAGNSQEYINQFKTDLAAALKVDPQLVEVRWAPNIFINIVLKGSIGVHLIANKNKI